MSRCVNVAVHSIDPVGSPMLAPGEQADLDLSIPHNQALLDGGLLQDLTVTQPEPALADLKVDELRARAEARGLNHDGLKKAELVSLLSENPEEVS